MIQNPSQEYQEKYKKVQQETSTVIKGAEQLEKDRSSWLVRFILKYPFIPIVVACLVVFLAVVLLILSISYKSIVLLFFAAIAFIVSAFIIFMSWKLDAKNWSGISLSDRWRMKVNRMLKEWDSEKDFLYCASCYKTELESLNQMFKFMTPILILIMSVYATLENWASYDKALATSLVALVAGFTYFFKALCPLSWVNLMLAYYSHIKTYEEAQSDMEEN